MRNKLTDLNNHLFMELERLGDESLTGEELKAEIERASAITNVSKALIEAGALAVKAEQLKAEWGGRNINMPELLEYKD